MPCRIRQSLKDIVDAWTLIYTSSEAGGRKVVEKYLHILREVMGSLLNELYTTALFLTTKRECTSKVFAVGFSGAVLAYSCEFDRRWTSGVFLLRFVGLSSIIMLGIGRACFVSRKRYPETSSFVSGFRSRSRVLLLGRVLASVPVTRAATEAISLLFMASLVMFASGSFCTESSRRSSEG
jgi:hypothetical protein